mmetsp:Transcript_14176/g.20727  ORF Transcript_14176/g.20727 Transcript_14176/m.20727 type:complete len:125 (+) Transcript_14176:38-412(+)
MLKKVVEKSRGVLKLPRSDPDYKTPLPDFKGQRRDPNNLHGGLPPSKTTTEMRYRPGPQHSLHPREVRVKTWLAFMGYLGWYVGVFLFIAYRLSSDDLDTLEKEARHQIEMRKKIKEQFLDDEE